MNFNRFLITFVFTTIATIPVLAQTDAELQSLVAIVTSLRSQTESSYKRASELLAADKQWTPMNETNNVAREVECRPADKVPSFKLNRILANVDNSRMYVSSHGDMLNGEDERYNYSLYERQLKAEKSAEYSLKGREGRQTFVIVPFNANASKISATLKVGRNKPVEGKSGNGGTIVIEYVGNDLKSEDVLILTIKNSSKKNQAFAIINHNKRTK